MTHREFEDLVWGLGRGILEVKFAYLSDRHKFRVNTIDSILRFQAVPTVMARKIRCSSRASSKPTQFFGPRENGCHALGVAFAVPSVFSHRSGLYSSGSSKFSGIEAVSAFAVTRNGEGEAVHTGIPMHRYVMDESDAVM